MSLIALTSTDTRWLVFGIAGCLLFLRHGLEVGFLWAPKPLQQLYCTA
jgi:hypothetical protein